MGLFTAVLTLPLAPVRGVVWVADRIGQAADRELRDPAVIRARLVALNEELENGLIDEEAFEREEDALLDLLDQGPGAPPNEPAHGGPPGDAEDNARREGPR
jgi:hypothetical protein